MHPVNERTSRRHDVDAFLVETLRQVGHREYQALDVIARRREDTPGLCDLLQRGDDLGGYIAQVVDLCVGGGDRTLHGRELTRHDLKPRGFFRQCQHQPASRSSN